MSLSETSVLTMMPRENPAGNLPFKLQIDVRDIGFLDQSGTWRKVLNVLDEVECSANGIQYLRTNETAQLFSRKPLDISTEHSLVKVSQGWAFNFLNTAELQM